MVPPTADVPAASRERWSWAPFNDSHNNLVDKYNRLLRDWNKFIPEYNAKVAPRNVGRPLAASEAQQADVLKRHKRGESLRSIAEDMSLGIRTVRSIVDQRDGVDRTTFKHLQRIKPEDMAAWKSRKRTRDALPRRLNALLKDKRDLLKEAKGLK